MHARGRCMPRHARTHTQRLRCNRCMAAALTRGQALPCPALPSPANPERPPHPAHCTHPPVTATTTAVQGCRLTAM